MNKPRFAELAPSGRRSDLTEGTKIAGLTARQSRDQLTIPGGADFAGSLICRIVLAAYKAREVVSISASSAPGPLFVCTACALKAESRAQSFSARLHEPFQVAELC